MFHRRQVKLKSDLDNRTRRHMIYRHTEQYVFARLQRQNAGHVGCCRRKMPDVVGEGANVTRWINAIGARPAVQKGMAGPQI